MPTFQVIFQNEPHRNRAFPVAALCRFDILNPCWDGRKNDIPGKHWAGGDACQPCTDAAHRVRAKAAA